MEFNISKKVLCRKKEIVVCIVSRMGDMYVSNALGKEFVNTNDVRANVTHVVKNPNCHHGFSKIQCRECSGVSICEHDTRKYMCDICGRICHHGKRWHSCKKCFQEEQRLISKKPKRSHKQLISKKVVTHGSGFPADSSPTGFRLIGDEFDDDFSDSKLFDDDDVSGNHFVFQPVFQPDLLGDLLDLRSDSGSDFGSEFDPDKI